MPELNAVLVEHRRKLSDERKFLAALQGVDMDAGQRDDAFASVQERAKKRVEEKTGKKMEDPLMKEFMNMGLDYEDLTGGANG